MVRERRRLFLHKGAWHKFRGYAYSQLAKISNQHEQVAAIRDFEEEHGIEHDTNYDTVRLAREERAAGHDERCLQQLTGEQLAEYDRHWRAGIEGDEDRHGSKRFYGRKRWGFDLKFATHLVRLIQECEQILTVGDIDLRRDSARLRDIRAGNWTESQVREWFQRREKELEPLYLSSKVVPYSPDEQAIKALLLEVLEEHYGSLAGAVAVESQAVQALRDIRAVLDRCKV
jgi:hypothetical protein